MTKRTKKKEIESMKDIEHPLIKLVTREQWGARPPKTPPEKLKIPVKMLQIFDTRTADCKTMDECKKTVLDLQNEYMFYRGFDDIPWNFLIGADGHVYEGRGFYNQSIKTDLEHPKQLKWNGKSVDVAYIGDYRRKNPKIKVKNALIYAGYILEKRKHLIYGQCKMQDLTMTPEKALVED